MLKANTSVFDTTSSLLKVQSVILSSPSLNCPTNINLYLVCWHPNLLAILMGVGLRLSYKIVTMLPKSGTQRNKINGYHACLNFQLSLFMNGGWFQWEILIYLLYSSCCRHWSWQVELYAVHIMSSPFELKVFFINIINFFLQIDFPCLIIRAKLIAK